MSKRKASRPARRAAIDFLVLTAGCAAFAAAAKMELIDADTTKRGIGITLGAMMIDLGNLLPKLRPLDVPSLEPGTGFAAERFAGWTLVLAGLVYLLLFAFAPLPNAKIGAAAAGFSAMVAIAINWTWFLRRHRRSGEKAERGQGATEKQRLVACLLFALGYVLLTACWVFVVGVNDRLAVWTTVGFSGAFACLYPTLTRRG